MEKENFYVVPQVKVIEVEVENGFALSNVNEGYEEGGSGRG